MTKLVNRAKMTTATTGTGTITLGSAVDGYQTFSAAGVADADVVRYVIEDGDAWEIGLGTYTASGTTLTRGSIESSNADNALNLTGNAVVYVSAAAADLQELVDFADNFVLPTSDGSTGQVLQTNGAGTLSFTTISGYTDADVDTHLNTGTASSGEVLSWTGSDYDWVAVSGGGAFTADGSDNLYAIATLPALTTGTNNFAAGSNAGNALTSGSNNVAIGNGAMDSATTGGVNIAIGQDAMGGAVATTSAGNNVAMGRQSGFSITSGSDNFLGGFRGGLALTTGTNNICIGYEAGHETTSGTRNIYLGRVAGYLATTGGDNVAIGYNTAATLRTGSNNIVMGKEADVSASDVSNEITLGNSSITRFRIPGIQSGASDGDVLTFNSSTGILELQTPAGGGAFTADGSNNIYAVATLPALTTGANNFVAGSSVGNSLTTGSNNVAIGNGALDAATTGGRNIAIGQDAMGLGVATNSTGDNIAIGYQAGYDLTTGVDNVMIGESAASNITGSSNNVYIGASAFKNPTSGPRNVVVGAYAVGNGTGSMDSSVAIGHEAAFSHSSSGFLVAVGKSALRSNTTGRFNVAVGNSAGSGDTTGQNNVFLGYQAGNSTTAGSNQIVIGQGADASSATVSNEITLGNSSITRFRIPGCGIDNTSAALSGTTPSVDVGARDTYTLTTSGNTTFTFTGVPSSGQVGTFSLIITAGGTHTLTWPASVDWAGGTAPDAPASGEKDIYTFMTVDGGTTWYGFLAGDAMA